MKKNLLFGVTLLVLGATAAFATPVTAACPVLNGGSAAGNNPLPAYVAAAGTGVGSTGCNVLITFKADGSIVTTNPNSAIAFETGADDNMVGIVNLTSHAITSVTLSGTTGIFDFENDGACFPSWTFLGGNPCGTATASYARSGITFSVVDSNHGTVNFGGGGIPSGGADWFSLEGPVDLNLRVGGTPEPASFGLVAVALLGLGFRLRSRR